MLLDRRQGDRIGWTPQDHSNDGAMAGRRPVNGDLIDGADLMCGLLDNSGIGVERHLIEDDSDGFVGCSNERRRPERWWNTDRALIANLAESS